MKSKDHRFAGKKQQVGYGEDEGDSGSSNSSSDSDSDSDSDSEEISSNKRLSNHVKQH